MNRRSFFGKLLGFALFAPTVKEAVNNVSKEKTVAPITNEQVMEAITKVHDKLCSGVAVSSMHLTGNCLTTFSTVNMCSGNVNLCSGNVNYAQVIDVKRSDIIFDPMKELLKNA